MTEAGSYLRLTVVSPIKPWTKYKGSFSEGGAKQDQASTSSTSTSTSSTSSTPPVDTRQAKAAMDQLSLLDTLNLSYAGNMDISHAVTKVSSSLIQEYATLVVDSP